ncbi:MAG TPA: hypothetical protein DIC42_06810 [Holosporales bacterium]|nr:hypothetical protein [Holosporales bacterium]
MTIKMLVSARSNFRRMNNVSMFVFPTPEDRQKFSDAIGADSVFMKPVDKNTFVTPGSAWDKLQELGWIHEGYSGNYMLWMLQDERKVS